MIGFAATAGSNFLSPSANEHATGMAVTRFPVVVTFISIPMSSRGGGRGGHEGILPFLLPAPPPRPLFSEAPP